MKMTNREYFRIALWIMGLYLAILTMISVLPDTGLLYLGYSWSQPSAAWLFVFHTLNFLSKLAAVVGFIAFGSAAAKVFVRTQPSESVPVGHAAVEGLLCAFGAWMLIVRVPFTCLRLYNNLSIESSRSNIIQEQLLILAYASIGLLLVLLAGSLARRILRPISVLDSGHRQAKAVSKGPIRLSVHTAASVVFVALLLGWVLRQISAQIALGGTLLGRTSPLGADGQMMVVSSIAEMAVLLFLILILMWRTPISAFLARPISSIQLDLPFPTADFLTIALRLVALWWACLELPEQMADVVEIFYPEDAWASTGEIAGGLLASLGIVAAVFIFAPWFSRQFWTFHAGKKLHYVVENGEQQLTRHALKIAAVPSLLLAFGYITYALVQMQQRSLLENIGWQLAWIVPFLLSLVLLAGASALSRVVAPVVKCDSISVNSHFDRWYTVLLILAGVWVLFLSVPEIGRLVAAEVIPDNRGYITEGLLMQPRFYQKILWIVLAIFLVFGWGFRRDIGASAHGGQ